MTSPRKCPFASVPWVLLFASLSTVSPEPVIAGQTASVTVDQILGAWQQREARFRSGKFVWKEVKFIAKGGHVSPDAKGAFPAEAVTHEYPQTLMFEGQKWRFSNDEPGVYSGSELYFFSRHQESVWDGTLGKDLRSKYPELDPFNYQGGVGASNPVPLKLVNVKPLVAHYRPTTPHLVAGLRRRSFIGRRGDIDISSCIVLEGSSGIDAKTGVNRTIWLDPDRGFIVRRWATELRGKPLSQFDVLYVEHPTHGWLPSRWRYLAHSPEGRLRESIEGRVIEQQINVKMKPEDFQLEFPPGTLVGDGTSPEGRQQYVICADGTTRRVFQEELNRGATLEDLYNSPPGQAALPRRTSTWKYFTVGLVVVLAVIVGVVVVREIRQHAAS